MKIGIYLEQKLEAGGGFQQAVNSLLDSQKNSKYEYIIFTNDLLNIKILNELNLNSVYLNFNLFEKTLLSLRRNLLFYSILKKFSDLNPFEKKIKSHFVDLVYFLTPSFKALDCENLNYIFTIWDLCHLDLPEFPEVRNNREFEKREFLFKNVCQKAFAIIADSNIGKKNLINKYLVNPDRVYVQYFKPSVFLKTSTIDINILKNKNIEPGYIFYPAQFWAHKNHVYILNTLKILKDEGYTQTAVFAGSNKGNFEFIRNKVVEMGLEKQIFFTGFVPNDHLRTYYHFSKCLAMPSFFGPTNIPPLEALSLEKPVFYSTHLMEGLREQVGDNKLAKPLNLSSPHSFSKQLRELNVENKSNFVELLNHPNQINEIFKNYEDFFNLYN